MAHKDFGVDVQHLCFGSVAIGYKTRTENIRRASNRSQRGSDQSARTAFGKH